MPIKNAREKLKDDKDFPVVKKIDKKMSKRWGTGTFVIPAPREVDALMKKVPRGKVTTINSMRAKLAKKHKTSIACPICTGIFASMAAWAAYEDEQEGKKRVTPYWRTTRGEGELNPKYPGGVKEQTKRLRKEGVKIKSGKKPKVEDLEKCLV